MNEFAVDQEDLRRAKILEGYRILDSSSERSFDSITRLAAKICLKPKALITLLDGDRLWFKSRVGVESSEVISEFSFCQFTVSDSSVFEVTDTLNNDEFKDHPFVLNEPYIRHYAGAPLISPEGCIVGTLCVMDVIPGKLTDLQREILVVLAEEIVMHMESGKRNRELEQHLIRAGEYHELFNNSGDLQCILSKSGEIEFVNKSANELIGYSVEELTGNNIWNYCVPGDQNLVSPLLWEGVKKGKIKFDVFTRVITKSGDIRNFNWCCVLKNDKWVVNGRDVTQHIKNKENLEQLSLVASHVENGVVINNAENRAVWVNKAFTTITGYSEEDILGKRVGDLISGEKTNIDSIDKARQKTNANKSFSVDILAYRKDKTPIWLSVMNSIILDENGAIEKTIEIITDITQQKESELEREAMNMALCKSTVGVAIRNKNNEVLWCNESFERLLGYTLSDLKGKQMGDLLVGPETNMEVFLDASRSLKNSLPYEIENIFYTKDGNKIWLYISNTPIFNEKNELDRQLCILLDITERKLSEFELIKTREEAIKLGKEKESFLSVMSHELRTPLNAITGITQILLEDNPQDYQMENLNVLKFSSENLITLINDILDFTKIETGYLKLESRTMDLKQLIVSTIESLQFKIDESLVSLEYNLDERIPQFIKGDKTRIYQIVINLIGNAIKFTKEGKIGVYLKVVEEDCQSISVKFEFTDSGIGIDESKLDYIFESYTQESADTTRKYGGTGLGLAITKKLINIHDSEIYVKSEKGKGSTFFFTIKFLRSDKSSINIPLHDVHMPLPSTVLVVDDNPINRLVAGKILNKWDIITEFAENGEEALNMIQQKDYDMVLMDLYMPVMDGYTSSRQIRALPDTKFVTLPIVAFTGSEIVLKRELLTEAGINDVVSKPIVVSDLYNKIRPFLKKE